MKLRARHGVLAVLVAALLAFGAALTGIVDVGGNPDRRGLVGGLSHFARHSLIYAQSLTVEEPKDRPMTASAAAAGHFARSCATCHGAPGLPRSPMALHMMPTPPDLALRAPQWNDRELFWIVRHGIGLSGMPAWPADHRDDEVWQLVALVRALPNMSAQDWRSLAYGPASARLPTPTDTFDQSLATCVQCHGSDGLGRAESVPVLAGQTEAYLLASLEAYASHARESGIMRTALAGVSPERFGELARHFAALPRPDQAPRADGDAEAGRRLAMGGDPERRIPACFGCHGVEPRDLRYPRIVGQPEAYLETQLRLFRDGERGGTRFHHLMTEAATRLTDDDIDALAAFLSRD